MQIKVIFRIGNETAVLFQLKTFPQEVCDAFFIVVSDDGRSGGLDGVSRRDHGAVLYQCGRTVMVVGRKTQYIHRVVLSVQGGEAVARCSGCRCVLVFDQPVINLSEIDG